MNSCASLNDAACFLSHFGSKFHQLKLRMFWTTPGGNRSRIFRAGTPPQISNEGTSRRTSEPAPTMAPSPILTPSQIMVYAPIHTSLPTTMRKGASASFSSPKRDSSTKVKPACPRGEKNAGWVVAHSCAGWVPMTCFTPFPMEENLPIRTSLSSVSGATNVPLPIHERRILDRAWILFQPSKTEEKSTSQPKSRRMCARRCRRLRIAHRQKARAAFKTRDPGQGTLRSERRLVI